MDRLLLDLRLALRRLRQNPGFSFVAIFTLALGIGANTAIFSVINAILLRPLPVERPSELVSLNETLGGNTFPTLSFPNYRDIRDRNNVLSGLVAYRILPTSLGLPGNSQRLWGNLVTGNYFDLLGVKPVRGRLLHSEDDRIPDGHPVVVLSYACWQKRFGGDASVVGRVVKFNSMDFTVLGVTPAGFFGTELYFRPEVFFPMMMQKQLEGGSGYLDRRETSNTFMLGRLKPGVTMAQAESALNSIARQLAEEYPKEDGGHEDRADASRAWRGTTFAARNRVRLRAVRRLQPGSAGGLHQSGKHAAGARFRPAKGNRHPPGCGRFARPPDPPVADGEPGGSAGRRSRRRAAGVVDHRRSGLLAAAPWTVPITL